MVGFGLEQKPIGVEECMEDRIGVGPDRDDHELATGGRHARRVGAIRLGHRDRRHGQSVEPRRRDEHVVGRHGDQPEITVPARDPEPRRVVAQMGGVQPRLDVLDRGPQPVLEQRGLVLRGLLTVADQVCEVFLGTRDRVGPGIGDRRSPPGHESDTGHGQADERRDRAPVESSIRGGHGESIQTPYLGGSLDQRRVGASS